MEENNNVNSNPQTQASLSTPARPTSAAKKRPETPKEKKSSNAGIVVMVIAIVALCGVVGFLLFKGQETNKILVEKQEKIDTLSATVQKQIAELQTVKNELEAMEAVAKELGLKVDSIPMLIDQINQLQASLASSRKLANASSVYKKERDELAAKVALLNEQIQALIQEKDAALAKIDTLNVEKRSLSDSLRSISREKASLAEKVEIASVMRAEEFSLSAVNAKAKEFPGPDLKAKQIDKLKLAFFLAENKVAPQNEKNIVMRLVEPDGTVLFGGNSGGSFTTAEGEEKMFSMSQAVSFGGSRQKVSFVYKKGSEYKRGKHRIEVFADGHKIGETFFNVK